MPWDMPGLGNPLPTPRVAKQMGRPQQNQTKSL